MTVTVLRTVRLISITIYHIGSGSGISVPVGFALEFPQPLVTSIVLMCINRIDLLLCHYRNNIQHHTKIAFCDLHINCA